MNGAECNPQATEAFWQPEWTGDPDQEFAGMTRPEELADCWMRKIGIWSTVTDNSRRASNPGIPDATSIGMFEGGAHLNQPDQGEHGDRQ